MKSSKMILAGLIAATLVAGQVGATTIHIDDTYIGANFHGWSNGVNDAISLPAQEFNIDSMDVTFNGSSKLSKIVINTTYAPHIGAYGTELGDLFIKTGTYNTPANSAADNFFNSANIWNYALVLDGNRKCSAGGTLSLYAINTDKSYRNDFYLSEDKTSSNYIFRNGQLVELKNTDLRDLGTIGTWAVDTGLNEVIFAISDTSKLLGTDFAFHWGMSCGNDVIEGGASAPVPEPSTFALLGAGLLGIGFIRCKMRK